jgi:hypothetical protein
VHNRRIYPTPGHHGLRHMVLTRPRAGPSMRFLSVGSHFCTWASFRHALTGLPLPSASGYPDDIGSSHRGLSPHKLMPMSGVHQPIQRTVQQRRFAPLLPGR